MNRVKAAQACIDRFNGKAYDPGKRDCAALVRHLLHQAGRGVPFLKGQRWSTEAGALRVMRRLGFSCLADGVDALGLQRIPPLAARAGDIVALPCDGGPWGCALTVAVGNGRVFGFLGGVGQVMQPNDYVCAWRV